MIQEEIKTDIKNAMKMKDTVRLSVLRSLLASFTNEAVANGKKPDEPLTDEEALKVLKRAANQRRDAANQFREGDREDLALNEETELQIIMEYLPEQMPREEIKKIAQQKKEEMNIEDKSKMGILIGAVMKETEGRADGKDVKEVVEEIL